VAVKLNDKVQSLFLLPIKDRWQEFQVSVNISLTSFEDTDIAGCKYKAYNV